MYRRIIIVGCGVAIIAVVGVSLYRWKLDSTSYCLLRFGHPGARQVILACGSDSLLLFRSGDIQATPERYPFGGGGLLDGVVIPPIEVGDDRSYTITSVREYTDHEPDYRHSLIIKVTIDGDAVFTQYCDVELSDSLDQMKYAHFDGPLSVGPVTVNWEVPPGNKFVIGGEPTDIRANVATLDKAGGCWTVVESGEDKFPQGVHPTVTVEFPAADSKSPIVVTYPLEVFC